MPWFCKIRIIRKFINYIRNELNIEYAIIHPQLCIDEGGRFFKDYLKDGDKNIIYIIGACDPRMQKKMFKDAFNEKGLLEKK